MTYKLSKHDENHLIFTSINGHINVYAIISIQEVLEVNGLIPHPHWWSPYKLTHACGLAQHRQALPRMISSECLIGDKTGYARSCSPVASLVDANSRSLKVLHKLSVKRKSMGMHLTNYGWSIV